MDILFRVTMYYWKLGGCRLQLMGVEIPAEYGGAESSFFITNLIIEEMAKVGLAMNNNTTYMYMYSTTIQLVMFSVHA